MIKKALSLASAIPFALLTTLFRIIPFRLLYPLSDLLAWLLRKVFAYRHIVVKENLDKSKLALASTERDQLVKEIYRNLSDVLLESIKSFSMSKNSIIKRHKLINPELLDDFYQKGQSIILVTGHLGNWEWGSLSASLQTSYRVLGFYKPLKNKYINNYIKKSRSKYDTILSPIRKTSLTFASFKDKPTLFLMAADQNPSKLSQALWVDFFGNPTAFLHGPEKHAINNHYPVIFCEINRTTRGHYTLELSLLSDQPKKLAPGRITELYAQKMESAIRKNPQNWLWTHRRWKHSPPELPRGFA